MFDKAFFEKHFVWQHGQLGSARTSVFLRDGTELKLRSVDKALDAYVLFQVFPPEGVNDESKRERRKPGGGGEVLWDRVAVPYESISYVWLSVTDSDQATRIGFAGGESAAAR